MSSKNRVNLIIRTRKKMEYGNYYKESTIK